MRFLFSVGLLVFSFFFFLFVLLFEMTGSTYLSVGGVCVCFVFGLGRIVFVGGISIVAVVILSRFCCLSIASTKAKRRSHTTTPTQANYGDNASVNIPQTKSLVSSSKRSFNNVPEMYSSVFSSVSSEMVENTCVIASASVFGEFLVFGEIVFVCFFFFLFLFLIVVGAKGGGN